MDIAFLATFLLVSDTGSMAEAARRLGVTPAAVAQQVRVLERDLGTPLLARSGRTVLPTEAGYRLLDRSRMLVREFAGLKALVNEAYATGELRIGTINTALHSLLPEILGRYVQTLPQVKIYIQSGTSMELFEAVRRGDLDAAVCLHPQFSLPKTFIWELLREERLVVLAPSRLAYRDPHDLLRSEPLIRYDRNLGGGKQADRYFRQAGIVPHERFELSSLAAIAMMVDQGLGVSLVPDIASPLTSTLQITKVSLPLETEPRRFGILWQRASIRSPLTRGLLEVAKQAIASK